MTRVIARAGGVSPRVVYPQNTANRESGAPESNESMPIDPHKTTIWDRNANRFVEATFRHDEDLPIENVEATGVLWSSVHSLFADKADILGLHLPDHSHWDWMKKARYYLPKIGFGFVSLECEGVVQGMMLCNNIAHSPITKDTGGLPVSSVYIEYLETAPWNLAAYTKAPRFAYVGTRLLSFAALNATMQCADIEKKRKRIVCRVGLHSLPDAVSFYLKLGFVDHGPDPTRKDRLPYLELPDEQARTLVRNSMKTVEE